MLIYVIKLLNKVFAIWTQKTIYKTSSLVYNSHYTKDVISERKRPRIDNIPRHSPLVCPEETPVGPSETLVGN